MAFIPFVFTDAQKVDIRRHMGFPAYGDGDVVFPYPWIMKFYLALEYRMLHMSAEEGAIVINTYLANLTMLENAIPAASANLDTDTAAVWKHNARELADRDQIFDSWRRRLANFMGVPVGPMFGGDSTALIV